MISLLVEGQPIKVVGTWGPIGIVQLTEEEFEKSCNEEAGSIDWTLWSKILKLFPAAEKASRIPEEYEMPDNEYEEYGGVNEPWMTDSEEE